MASRLELEETGAFADGEACCGAGCWEETVVTATDEGPQPMYLTLHYTTFFNVVDHSVRSGYPSG